MVHKMHFHGLSMFLGYVLDNASLNNGDIADRFNARSLINVISLQG